MGGLVSFQSHAEHCGGLLREAEAVTLVAHHDADGVATAAVLRAALDRAEIDSEVRFVPQADPALLETLEGPLVVWAELGSGLLEEMKSRRYRSLVVDHHPPSGRPGGRVEMLNPYSFGFEGSTEISGAGVAWFLACALDPSGAELADLAVVGALGDGLDRRTGRLEGLARAPLGAGRGRVEARTDLRVFGARSRPLVACLSGLPGLETPGRVASFLREVGLPFRSEGGWLRWGDLDPFQRGVLGRALLHLGLATGMELPALFGETYSLPGRPPPLRDGAEFASLLNATGRYGRGDLGLDLCLRGEGFREVLVLANRHRRAIQRGVRAVVEAGPAPRNRYRYFDGRSAMPEEVVGAVASLSMRRLRDPGPLVVFSGRGSTLKLSARATLPAAPLGPAMAEAAHRAGGIGGGHGCAAGARIPVSGLEPFLEALDIALERPGSPGQ